MLFGLQIFSCQSTRIENGWLFICVGPRTLAYCAQVPPPLVNESFSSKNPKTCVIWYPGRTRLPCSSQCLLGSTGEFSLVCHLFCQSLHCGHSLGYAKIHPLQTFIKKAAIENCEVYTFYSNLMWQTEVIIPNLLGIVWKSPGLHTGRLAGLSKSDTGSFTKVPDSNH